MADIHDIIEISLTCFICGNQTDSTHRILIRYFHHSQLFSNSICNKCFPIPPKKSQLLQRKLQFIKYSQSA